MLDCRGALGRRFVVRVAAMGVDGGDRAGRGGQLAPIEAIADGLYDGELVDLAGALAGEAEAGFYGLLDRDCGPSVAGRLAGRPECDGVLHQDRRRIPPLHPYP